MPEPDSLAIDGREWNTDVVVLAFECPALAFQDPTLVLHGVALACERPAPAHEPLGSALRPWIPTRRWW